MSIETHPELEDLIAHARGTLPRSQEESVHAHCAQCKECGQEQAMILLLRGDHRQRMRRGARRKNLLLAAMVVLLAGTAATLMLSGYFSDRVSGFAALATTETIPESHVHMRFRRGLRASGDLYDRKLEAGMVALVQQDYRKASETLEELFTEHPESSETAAYLGVAFYLSGDDSDRTKAILAQGAQDMQPMISRTATWFLANSCLRSDDIYSAAQLLRTLYPSQINDMYGRWSVELLRRIQDIQNP